MQRVLLFFSVFACFGILAGAVMYLKLMPVQEVEAAPYTVTCSTGFSRPLLFGINPVEDGEALKWIDSINGSAARISFNWNDIEPTKGQLITTFHQVAASQARELNTVLVGQVVSTPNWASNNTALIPARALPKKSEEAAFRNFVKTYVQKYKDDIRYWEFGNEPNGCGSSRPPEGDTSCHSNEASTEEYVYWLNVFYDTVKSVDPNIKVIGGNLDRHDANFIGWMNNADQEARYDYLGIHPYKEDADLDINMLKAAYDAAKPFNGQKRKLWLGEWGWNSKDRATVAGRIQRAFQELVKLDYVEAAFYQSVRDAGDDNRGLMESKNSQIVPRDSGQAFKNSVSQICGNLAVVSSGGSINPPTAAGGNNITVRSYFAASAQSTRPRISLYVNNAAGFVSATSANDPTPNDTLPCDGSVAGPQVKCGGLNLYKEKLIEDFEVTTDTFVKDVVIPADKLVYLTGDGLGFTKLSYVFHNRDNNAVGVTKIEFYAPDGKLILTYAPQKGSQQYTVTPNQGSRALEKFYFDLGQVSNSSSDNYGMVKAFDKISLQPKNDNDDYWTLSDEGSFNLVSVGIHKAIVNAYGGLSEPACVVASNDIGGTALKRGIPLTLSSVASVPIKNFRFSFYNPDNRDPNNNNSPKAFCVKGASPQTGDGCPAGSGQLVVDIASSINGSGAIQATDWFLLPNEQLLQSTWRGDMSWNRPIPYDPSTLGNPVSVSWNFSSYLSNITTIGSFKPTAEIDALDTFYGVFGKDIRDKKLTMEIWRNNQLWTTTAGFISTGSYIDWNTATPWTKVLDLNEKPADLPGTGQVTATGSFIAGNTLWQVYWRGTEEWIRSVAYSTDGKPNFSAANKLANKGYTLNRNISTLPGSVTASKVQAISFMQNSASRTIQEQIWINNSSWKRTIPQGPNQVDAVDFAKASSYAVVSDTPPGSNQSASTLVAYNTINQPDVNNGNKVPVNLQVNATFTTTNGKEIGNQGACVTWFTIDKSIQGDVNGDCVNDIYDYNLLLQHFETNNCQYNLVGDCRIDQNDLDDFKNRYGQSCPQ